MIAQILKIKELCTPAVTFYTIKFDDKSKSEITDFYTRLAKETNNHDELTIIDSVIDEIGERTALKRYFSREERDAYALPPYNCEYIESEENDYGIRLYCVVLNPEIVFLLNGDRKKTQSAQDEKSNVSHYFYMANSLYKELIKDKLEGIIKWEVKGPLTYDEDYQINIKG